MMVGEFGESQGEHQKFVFPARERFCDKVCQVERRAAGGDNLNVGYVVHDALYAKPDVGNALRFVDYDSPFRTDNCL